MLKYSSKSFIKLLKNFFKNLFIFFKKFLMLFLIDFFEIKKKRYL
jgi:hypothetical protein